MPGTRLKPTVTTSFEIAGDIQSFDRDGFIAGILNAFPEAEGVHLNVHAASVRVDVQIIVQSVDDANAATNRIQTTPVNEMQTVWFANVQGDPRWPGGLAILNQPTAAIEEAYVSAPSPPPPHLPPPPSPPPPPPWVEATQFQTAVQTFFIVFGVICGLALLWLIKELFVHYCPCCGRPGSSPRVKPMPPATTAEKVRALRDKRLDELDTDGDGVISWEELHMPARRPPHAGCGSNKLLPEGFQVRVTLSWAPGAMPILGSALHKPPPSSTVRDEQEAAGVSSKTFAPVPAPAPAEPPPPLPVQPAREAPILGRAASARPAAPTHRAPPSRTRTHPARLAHSGSSSSLALAGVSLPARLPIRAPLAQVEEI